MGTLYIIATPIGNLKDITLRALEALKEVDLILCEDTRQTIKLLNHYGISKPLVSYFQHSKISKVDYVIEQLKLGKKLALVTDAGTPGISDPGGKLIEQLNLFPEGSEAKSKDFKKEQFYPLTSSGNKIVPYVRIIPIPGPSALIAALSVSGFPADKFIFMGFPPHKKGREKFFKEVGEAKYTVVFYESVHRILKTLNQLIKTPNLTDRQIVVCKELTKIYESVYRGMAKEILSMLESDKKSVKGEFVVIIHGSN